MCCLRFARIPTDSNYIRCSPEILSLSAVTGSIIYVTFFEFTMINEACCTCAKSLSFLAPHFNEKTEKPKAQDRRLDCCGRIICSACIDSNSRFNNYCIIHPNISR